MSQIRDEIQTKNFLAVMTIIRKRPYLAEWVS